MPATGPVDEGGEAAVTDVAGGTRAPVPVAHVALPPEPGAASTAREWVAAALHGWPAQSIDTARLLVSELVTNAVLHARTEIALRHHREAERARIEVSDGRRDGPMPKRYSPNSPTGRGLRLVDALAAEWGVTRSPEGKVVWFVVTPESGSTKVLAAHLGTVDVPHRAATGAGSPAGSRAGAPVDPPTETPAEKARFETVPVQVLSLPLEVYLEAEQHNDAIMRELMLLLQSSEARSGLDVPARLLEIAAEVRARFGAAATSIRKQVERAIEQRQETVDIVMEIPVAGWEALGRLASQLDEVDRFCATGDLLTLGSSPRLRRFRRWYVQQVADQVQGLPATPWPEDTESLPM